MLPRDILCHKLMNQLRQISIDCHCQRLFSHLKIALSAIPAQSERVCLSLMKIAV